MVACAWSSLLISSVPLTVTPFFFMFCSTCTHPCTSSGGRQRATLGPQMEIPERSSRPATSSIKIQIPCKHSGIKVDHDVTLGLVKLDVFPPLSILAYCSQRSMHVALVPLLSFSYDKLAQERVTRVSASAQRTRVSHASTRSPLFPL